MSLSEVVMDRQPLRKGRRIMAARTGEKAGADPKFQDMLLQAGFELGFLDLQAIKYWWDSDFESVAEVSKHGGAQAWHAWN